MSAENVIAQAPTGGLDQTASLRCASGRALRIDCVTFAVEQVPFDLAAAGLELLVTDTRARHAHAHGGYGAGGHSARTPRQGSGWGTSHRSLQTGSTPRSRPLRS
jgi:galactokinase